MFSHSSITCTDYKHVGANHKLLTSLLIISSELTSYIYININLALHMEGRSFSLHISSLIDSTVLQLTHFIDVKVRM